MGCRGEVFLLHLLKFGSASGEIRSGVRWLGIKKSRVSELLGASHRVE